MKEGGQGLLVRFFALVRSYPVSVTALIVSNVVPLIGVLFFGWDVPTILFTYWLETGIVGAINIPKILIVMRANGERLTPFNIVSGLGFFVIHYGIFFFVNGLLVMLVTGVLDIGNLDPFTYVMGQPQIIFAAALLLVSHLVSLWVNFIGRREYAHTSPELQQFRPYPRMIVLQLTILVGGFAVWALGQPAVLVALLVLFKTMLDLVLHLAHHANTEAANTQRKKGPKGMETTLAT